MTSSHPEGPAPLPSRLPSAELTLLAPAFVELREDQSEAMVAALAELLATAAERSGSAAP